MKSLQKVIPAFAIAVYVAIFVGGRVLHQHHCDATIPACCKHSSNTASLATMHQDCPPVSTNIFEETRHPSNGKLPKDETSNCWTCYTLSQAGNSPAEITPDLCTQSVCLACPFFETPRLQACTQSYLVRGPPETLLATS